jgi:hypothetical protein
MLLLRQQPGMTVKLPCAAMFRAVACTLRADISIDKKDIG